MLRPKTAVVAAQAAHHLADAAAHRASQHRRSSHAAAASLGCRVPLVVASLTDPIVQFAVDVIDKLGLPGIFVLMVAESACIPIPSEATFLFAGFNVSRGRVLDVRRRRGGHARQRRRLLDRLRGRLLRPRRHPREARQEAAHQAVATWRGPTDWFEKYGSWTVFLTRMLPIIRTFISLPAGVARMPFWRFTVLTTLGCIPWIFMLTFIGREVGDRWESWKDSLHYVDYAVAAMIVARRRLPACCATAAAAARARGGRRAGRRCVALRSSRSG